MCGREAFVLTFAAAQWRAVRPRWSPSSLSLAEAKGKAPPSRSAASASVRPPAAATINGVHLWGGVEGSSRSNSSSRECHKHAIWDTVKLQLFRGALGFIAAVGSICFYPELSAASMTAS